LITQERPLAATVNVAAGRLHDPRFYRGPNPASLTSPPSPLIEARLSFSRRGSSPTLLYAGGLSLLHRSRAAVN